MDIELIKTLLPFIGTLLGSGTGILVANKLTNYRIEQLERKVEKHNNVIDRTYKLELKDAVHDEKFKELAEKVASIEKGD